jgi:phosphate transport system substrate-binding protein
MRTILLPRVKHVNSLVAAVAVTSAAFALLLVSGCTNYSEDGRPPAEPTFGSTQVRTFSAAGSTFIAPLMSRWSSDYAKAHNVKVNYRSIGSGAGLSELKQGLLTFAISDAPLTDSQLKDLPPLVQIPVTAGPVCVIYNLPGLNVPLRLSGKTLADIYSGAIVSWQDAAISHENPGVKLPHMAITVVHRADGSGTTSIFTSYLSSVSPAWSSKIGHGLDVNWPSGIGGLGSQNVLRDVQGRPGAIGYLELSYARQAGLPVASIQNKAGEFVVPSPDSAALAITAYHDALMQDLRIPIVDPPASAKGAYPISGLTFVLIPRDNRMAGEQLAFRDFITYAISSGQLAGEELSYTKLPAEIQEKSQSFLTQLTENGRPLR